jgi:hypothetical protein
MAQRLTLIAGIFGWSYAAAHLHAYSQTLLAKKHPQQYERSSDEQQDS